MEFGKMFGVKLQKTNNAKMEDARNESRSANKNLEMIYSNN